MDEEEEQPSNGDASVELSANIQSDRTLSADTDYVVTSSFCVENSSTLTIEAGTRLAFESGTGLKVCGDGSALVAQGTSSDGILMTGTTEQPGFWNGVGLNSSNANNELSHVTIEYAGGEELYSYTNGAAGLQIESGSAVSIANTTLRNNSNYGLSAEGGVDLSGFAGNTFENNETTSMNVRAVNMGALDAGTSYGSPVRINDGSISGETLTISAIGVPYRLSGVRSIDDGSDVTVEAGTTFEFESGAGLKIDGGATAFRAQGAQADSVRLTGTSKQKGFWDGIGVTSDNVENEMSYVVVEYAGGEELYTFSTAGNIQVNGGQLELTNSLIQDSGSYGLTNDGAPSPNRTTRTAGMKMEPATSSVPSRLSPLAIDDRTAVRAQDDGSLSPGRRSGGFNSSSAGTRRPGTCRGIQLNGTVPRLPIAIFFPNSFRTSDASLLALRPRSTGRLLPPRLRKCPLPRRALGARTVRVRPPGLPDDPHGERPPRCVILA